MASEEKIYMVMELVSGGELFDKIVAEGPMSEQQARRVLHELMSALDAAHKQGIFHRDLKVPSLPPVFFLMLSSCRQASSGQRKERGRGGGEGGLHSLTA